MVYSVDMYPKTSDVLEEVDLFDKDGELWQVIRTSKNIYLNYLGESVDYESFEIKPGNKALKIKNHNLYRFNHGSFEFYCYIRDVIKCSSSEGVMDVICDFLLDRLTKQMALLDSEIM